MDSQTNNDQALKHLQELLEFTNVNSLRKSLTSTLFAYLKEQDKVGVDSRYKSVIVDHQFLLEFLDLIEN